MATLNHVLQITMMLMYLHRSHSAEIQSRYISINAKCNFAKPKLPFRNEMTVYKKIPEKCSSPLYCNVWYDFSDHHVLRMWLERSSGRNSTSLVSTVMDQHGALVLPGYVAEADENVSYLFLICLGKDGLTSRNYSIYLSAPPEAGLNLTVQVDESMLRENHTKSIELGYKMSSRLLVFNIPNIRSIDDHFQVLYFIFVVAKIIVLCAHNIFERDWRPLDRLHSK